MNGLATAVDDEASFIVRTYPRLVPSVWPSAKLIVASDYSGMQAECVYESYSFLLVENRTVAAWNGVRSGFRRLIPDGRRISWKRRKDKIRQRAEQTFLASADRLEGLLATFLVDKATARRHLFPPIARLSHPVATEINRLWQPDVYERAMRVAWFGATLLAGLASRTQSFAWLPDDDDIMAEPMRKQLSGKAMLAARHLMQPGCPPNLQLATPSDYQTAARRLEREDLLSVPDYAAGALAQLFTLTKQLGYDPASPLIGLVKGGIPDDVLRVAAWIGKDSAPLKRWVFIAVPGGQEGAIRFGSVRLRSDLAASQDTYPL